MSPRDTAAAGQRARHARARLQAALGEAPPGLLEEGEGLDGFEYRGMDSGDGAGNGSGAGAVSGGSPPLRWRVGLRVATLLAVLGIMAGAWFWWQAAAAAPVVLPLDSAISGGGGALPGDGHVSGDSTETPADPGSREATAMPAGTVVVHVAGAVAKPGVIRLRQGSRVDDAIAAAGGATEEADANRLNLALVAEDGQKIYVPNRGESLAATSGASGAVPRDAVPGPGQGAAPGSAAGKINLNTADAAELDLLPKVGPVLAQRIVDWRKEHGPFKSIEELDSVDGVGPKMLEALLPLVMV